MPAVDYHTVITWFVVTLASALEVSLGSVSIGFRLYRIYKEIFFVTGDKMKGRREGTGYRQDAGTCTPAAMVESAPTRAAVERFGKALPPK